MAEKKATSATAKPRKTADKPAAKKKAATALPDNVTEINAPREQAKANREVSREEIAKLAHQLWNERGRQHGHAEEDWIRAEQLLRGKAS